MRYMRYIRDIILLNLKFNWGILRSWASPDSPSQNPIPIEYPIRDYRVLYRVYVR